MVKLRKELIMQKTKIGNLFELAEMQLIKEILRGKRIDYSMNDIIDYAVKIRKWLDKKNNLKSIIGFNRKKWRKQYYLRTKH